MIERKYKCTNLWNGILLSWSLSCPISQSNNAGEKFACHHPAKVVNQEDPELDDINIVWEGIIYFYSRSCEAT